MLATMSELDPLAASDWSDAGMNEPLPTGTVTLLLADVEGSTQLWQSKPDEMTAAIANLDRTLAQLVGAHHGVRPMEQGEGDSFVVAFDRASNAVGVRAGAATGAAGAVAAAHRGAYRRSAVARREQLRRARHQPDRATPRTRARRPDGSVRAPPAIWLPTRCPRTRGWPTWAPIRCAICPVRNGSSSCVIPICATNSRRCGCAKPLSPNIFPRS